MRLYILNIYHITHTPCGPTVTVGLSFALMIYAH